MAAGAAATVSCLVAVLALSAWFGRESAAPADVRVPGTDGTPAGMRGEDAPVDLRGTFQAFEGVPGDLPGAWPSFRGADRDNIVKDGVPLADSWGKGGPPLLWKVELGEGYAGAAVWGGRVYVLDYDESAKADAIRCFSLADGREIWRRSYAVVVKKNHGMSRTVPAVTEKHLVTIGPRCHVVCLDPITGDFKWGMDLQREYGTEEPLWYTGQCPLIDGSRLVVAPGGPDALIMAVDLETGAPVWKTPNPHGWKMSHSSVMPAVVAGKGMYVYAAVGGVSGVDCETGALLWELPWSAKVVAPSPVALDDGRIFLAAGYGEGGMMIRVRMENGTFTAGIEYKHGPKDGLACEQQTPIYHDGLLFGIMPKDAGALRGQFVCYNPDGTRVWSSGQTNRFGLGPFILADGKFYVLDDEGVLTLLRASRVGYEQIAQAKVLEGHDAWGPIALAHGRMLLRDSTHMACIAVDKKESQDGNR
ncbi:MAG TPA: PQQ-binding-like beta-propeller repeat protein [Candidatus Hydrogenedentes bacterium]|nr:PQQ-binding-like beta-propeller repeat protein [Candidatus Hydrogenedentota bacterium]